MLYLNKKEKHMRYFKNLYEVTNMIKVTDKNKVSMTLETAIEKAINLIVSMHAKKKLIFIGNGGSASIASHQAVDFWKNGKIPAIAFNDASLLTCISNDYGYDYVFQKPIETFAKKDDILFAISSSGRSKNIINAVKSAKKIGCSIITLSGFDASNPLRKLGDINFYVPSHSYGPVEITHLAICHCILDYIIENKRDKLFIKKKNSRKI